METVTVSRRIDAPPDAVLELVEDVQQFMEAGGFAEVRADGEVIELENRLGFATISLTLERLDGDAPLAYRQRDGMFREMTTRYDVEALDGGTRVTATTDFELGGSVVGEAIESTIVHRQRVRELESQFDYLADELEG